MKAFLSPFVVCVLAILMAGATLAHSTAAIQDKDKKAPQVSADEQKALMKIKTAADPSAKLQAASEFVKKYPKSTVRYEAASYVASEIAKADAAAQITLSQNFLTIFTESKEAAIIQSLVIDAYIKTNKVDEAFKTGAAYLEKNPEDVAVLTQLALTGVDQAKRQNGSYVQQSATYGAKAISLIEADKMPDTFSAEDRTRYKTFWMPYLYQSLGLIAYMTGNKEDARAKLDKAVAGNPNDPFTYVLLGSLVNEEYQALAERHKTMMSGPLKDETLKRANAKVDEIIDFYAHAVGLSEGKAEYQQLHDQILTDLTAYYKYRHNNSADGLQALIDKYKKP
jgi:predicted Zn-dependent protease